MTEASFIREDTAFKLAGSEILARLDGDSQLLADLCDLLLAELPRMMDSLKDAVRIEDANAAHRAAHRLKGSLSVFGAGPHLKACEALEKMALNCNMSEIPEILSRLESHLGQFSAAVAALGKESHARADRG